MTLADDHEIKKILLAHGVTPILRSSSLAFVTIVVLFEFDRDDLYAMRTQHSIYLGTMRPSANWRGQDTQFYLSVRRNTPDAPAEHCHFAGVPQKSTGFHPFASMDR